MEKNTESQTICKIFLFDSQITSTGHKVNQECPTNVLPKCPAKCPACPAKCPAKCPAFYFWQDILAGHAGQCQLWSG